MQESVFLQGDPNDVRHFWLLQYEAALLYSFAAVGSTERTRFHAASFKLYKNDDNEEAAMCFVSDLAKHGWLCF